MFSNKVVRFIFLLSVFSFIVYLSRTPNLPSSNERFPTEIQLVSSPDDSQSETADALVNIENIVATEKTEKTIYLGDHIVQVINIFSDNPELKKWVIERGYLPRELLPEKDFDDALLQAEASSGNMNAQHLLAETLLKQRKYSEAESWLLDAASRGSTRAVVMLAELNYMRMRDDPEHARNFLDSAKAWLLVADLRGDPMGKIAWQYFGLESELESDNLSDIETQSQRFYLSLVRQRGNSGLGNFSNAVFPQDDLSIFQYLEK